MRRFGFHITVGDCELASGVIEIEDLIFSILRKEETEREIVVFDSDEDFAAHLAWRIVTRKERISDIEGFEYVSDRLVRIVEYPTGYNDFQFTATEIEERSNEHS
jgi:hypothetical protein